MSNYVRQSSFSNGDIIEAPFFNAEFDQLVEAFTKETGHKHDGSDGEGGYIPLIANEDNSTGVRIDTADPSDHKLIFKIDGVDVMTLSEANGLVVDNVNVKVEDLANVSTPVANGYFRWNAAADTVEFLATIDASDTTGFATIATSGNIADSNDAADIATSGSIKDTNEIGTPVNLGYWKWDSSSAQIIYSTVIPHTDISGLDSANFTHNSQNMKTFLDDLDARATDAAADAAAAAASAQEATEEAVIAVAAADRAEAAVMGAGIPEFIADGGSYTIGATQEIADLTYEGDGTLVLPTTLTKGSRFYARVSSTASEGKLLTILNPNFTIVGDKQTVPSGTDLQLEPAQLVILEAINTTTLEII